ncbi:MAG: T9SS type A sorting domain-containing protein [Candidatus Zixiibacteriota bacterium]
MKRYLFGLMILMPIMLLFAANAEQYSGFPVVLFDGEASPPVCFNGDDVSYIGTGGSDSSFHITAVEYPASYHQLTELEGSVAKTAAVTYDERFAVQTENGLLYLINTSGAVASGFPVDLGGDSEYTSPVCLPDDRIIAIAGNSIYEVSLFGDTRLIADFESPYGAVASPAAGDIDADGDYDIIVPGWERLYAFDIETGASLDSFPVALEEGWHYSYSAPVIADLKNDGHLEVIIGIHQTVEENWGAIMVARAGVGALLSYPVALSRGGSWVYATPAIADIDEDLLPEINFTATDGYVYSMDADISDLEIFKTSFYVTSGSLEGSMVMLSTNGDRVPEFNFVSADTGKIVRREFSGTEPDTLDMMIDGTYGMTAPNILEYTDGSYLLCSTSEQGNLNLWTLCNYVPEATPKWLHQNSNIHCDGIYPEPPGSLWVRDIGDYFRVSWTEPKAYAIPPDSYTVYRPDPESEDSTELEIAFSGTALSTNTTIAFDSSYIYVTAHYPNGTESAGRSILVYEGQSVHENITQNDANMINIIPNPFNNTCRIESNKPIGKMTITDTNGRIIDTYENVSHETSLKFASDIPSGVYLVHIENKNGDLMQTQKAVYLK